MSIQIKRRVLILLIMSIFLVITSSCSISEFVDPPTEDHQLIGERKYFSIDPETLLLSISEKKDDTFLPEDFGSYQSSTSSGSYVKWTSSNYYIIAQSVFQLIWNESLDQWHLNKIYYGMNCKDINNGIQVAQYEFFQNIKNGKDVSRLTRTIFIEPLIKSVSGVETKYSPKLSDWHSIDIGKMKVSSEDALKIAEMAGGEKARLIAEEPCFIDFTYARDSYFDGWQVGYQDKNTWYLFDINIDPFTGDYKITH